MPFRQDFIERLIQKLAEGIARALGVARNGQPDEGIALLEGAVTSGFGLPLGMLLKLTPDTVRSLVGVDRAPALADALRAYAEILKLAGRDVEARASERLATELDQRRP